MYCRLIEFTLSCKGVKNKIALLLICFSTSNVIILQEIDFPPMIYINNQKFRREKISAKMLAEIFSAEMFFSPKFFPPKYFPAEIFSAEILSAEIVVLANLFAFSMFPCPTIVFVNIHLTR